MKMLTLLSFILLLTAIAPYPSYPEYLQIYGKAYENAEEQKDREDLYYQRLKLFETFDKFSPGVNKFTDMYDFEIQSMLYVIDRYQKWWEDIQP